MAELQLSQALLLVGAIYVLFRLATSVTAALHRRSLARQYKCQPPVRFEAGFLGIPEFRRFMAAAGRHEHVEWASARYLPNRRTFVINNFGTDSIATIEPANIKTVLATNFKDYGLGPSRHEAFHRGLGDGIFTLDGKGWEHSRALLRPQFSRAQVADVELLDVHVSRLLGMMTPGVELDLQPWLFSLTLDSATEFLFGESAEALLTPPNANSFEKAFDEMQSWIMWKLRYRGLTKMWTPGAMTRANAKVHAFANRYVAHALDRKNHPHPKAAEGKYIFLDAVAQQTRDPKALRDQMLNVLLAGRDTTAGLMGWTFYLLARHPEVYRKLRAALEEAFGTGTPGVWQRPGFEGLKDVVYLRHVLNEVLRLYPSVPLNSRDSLCDTVLPTGGGPDGTSSILVPKGTRVLYSVYALHRRKDIWGDDAEVFRPERWSEKRTLGGGWEWLPFNGGPRVCLGQQYALTEAGFTVARVLQRFERMEPVYPSEKPVINATLTIAPMRCAVRVWPVQA